MKTSTLLLITILPIELMTLLLFFLPEKHLITGIMMMALYFGIIMLISGKYIKRGDNAHLISGVDISYEEARLPENIEKYSKDSKIVGNICLGVGSICFLIVIVYFIVINRPVLVFISNPPFFINLHNTI